MARHGSLLLHWLIHWPPGRTLSAIVGILAAGGAVVCSPGRGALAMPQSPAPNTAPNTAPNGQIRLRPVAVCPSDFEPLTQALVDDLPDYTNRVLARSKPDRPAFDLQTHVAIASQATYADAVPGNRWSSPSPERLVENGVQQTFFTTLERQYVGDRLTTLQHYHWALIADTADGWRLVGLFSRIAGYPANQPPSPFVDSTYGDVGRAIELWLRDCRAGAIDMSL